MCAQVAPVSAGVTKIFMGKPKQKRKKMKLFQTIREYVQMIGINQNDRFSGKILKASFLYGFNSILNCAFLFHKARTFREYTDDIYMTSATIVISISFITVIVKMSRLFKFINRCERITEKILEYPASKTIYDETNQRIENWTKIIYFFVVKVTPVCWIFPKFAISIFLYLTTDMGRDALKLPIPMWFPFNTKHPIGYCVAIILQYALIAYNFFLLASMVSLGVGAYLFTISMAEYIKDILNSINERAKQEDENQMKDIVSSLADFIDIYSILKELVRDFSEVYQPIYMDLFTRCLITICGGMLMIRLNIPHHGNNTVAFMIMVLYGCFGFFLIYLVCELSQRISNAFEDICDAIDTYDWYLYPIELQRMLPLIILPIQRPVVIRCFGCVQCSRRAFKNVFKVGLWYYLAFRMVKHFK